MTKYRLVNNIVGWGVFVIAAIVYLMTIEPTASFWDCGEFITSAYKLEVGHPPGAPFFMLMGNFFTHFAKDPSQVAMMVNGMSALLSALTILFLFWSITHLTRKLILGKSRDRLSVGEIIVVIGSGLVGALAYTFSDTFWFSAVEGEVYAFSSMITALVFLLILKWEDNADNPHSDKWIVLIAYIMGLSIGVHLLNLLCIPAIVLVYYYKKNETATWKGVTKALLLSFGLIIVLMYGIIPGFTHVGGWFELFFVNTVGLSYNSGVVVYFILLLTAIVWGLFQTMKSEPNSSRLRIAFIASIVLSGIPFMGSSVFLSVVLLVALLLFVFRFKKINVKFINLTLSSLLVILIGYSTYALIPIRSAANPPMDQNSPEDVFTLTSYLNREQYGDRPLFYGRTYASSLERDAQGNVVKASEKNEYRKIIKTSPEQKDHYIASKSATYKFTNSMLFPRMHSYSGNPGFSNHLTGYRMWGGVANEKKVPTMLENIRFLFSYQINYMYWRYFMWNFSGRQNDLQGDGGITKGNWITGIPFIDGKILGLGPQKNIAPDIADNKGRNVYFMLPFILGVIGIVYQLRLKEKGYKNFSVVFMLFFMTGIAIVLYLNQSPFEPRERDYAYAGSFYAFAIWIGIGVAGISGFLKKYLKNTTLAGIVATVACLCVPVLMAAQNWDDHDRSGRTMAHDAGRNYLSSVEKDGIIFTNGDNDTFPLWYSQEVEGYRTDVRVCNLSYLQTEWYVDQMVRQAYESKPLPIKWSRSRYSGNDGSHAYIITNKQIENVLRQNDIAPMQFLQYYDTNSFRDTISLTQTMEQLRTGKNITPKNPFIDDGAIIPGNLLTMKVDSSSVDWQSLNAKPTNKMVLNLSGKNAVYRQEMMIMEMLSNLNNSNWDRPLYYAATVGPDTHLNMTPNFSLEGLTYRVTPGRALNDGVNTDVTFDNMMHKFLYGGAKHTHVYFDENTRKMATTHRAMFARLIGALIEEGKDDKALAALEKCFTEIPTSTVPLGIESISFIDAYYVLGKKEKAEALIAELLSRVDKNLDWFDRLSPQKMANCMPDINENLYIKMQIALMYQAYEHEKYQPMTDDLLQRVEFYFRNGLAPLGNSLLKGITDNTIRGFQIAANKDDSMGQLQEEGVMQQAIKLMQQYSPRLLEQYNRQ